MDPFSTLMTLLRPRAVDSKLIETDATYGRVEKVGLGLVLEGGCRLEVSRAEPFSLAAGDFVLLTPNEGFVLQGDFRMLGGSFEFEAGQTDLLRSLVPAPLVLRQADQLSQLVDLIRQESLQRRPGRELVLQKLVEVLLVQALREGSASSGLLRGLADPDLTVALHCIHEQPAHPWTIAELAARARQSRSAFCQNFSRTVGLAPKEYLIFWRMALAQDLLARRAPLKKVAEAIGYQSSSAFSTAFRRQFGHPPGARRPLSKPSE